MTTTGHDEDFPWRAELWRTLARGAAPVGPDATIAAVNHSLDRRRRRRRRTTWAVIAAGALALGAAIIRPAADDTTLVADSPPDPAAATIPGSQGDEPDSTTARPAAADDPGRPAADRTPLAPLQIRAEVALAWTGTEVMVWGGHLEAENWGLPGSGQTSYSDGAAYDPATGRWRLLAPAPLPDSPAATPHAVTVDGGVLVARDRSAAIWDPSTDTWRSVSDAPAPIDDLAGAGPVAVSYSARAVLDVPTGKWRALPEPPMALDRPATAWTGSQLVVVGDRGPSGTSPVSNAGAMTLDPATGTWRALDAPPIGGAEGVAAAFDGRRVVMVNYDGTAAALEPGTAGGDWRKLPRVPFRFYENQPRAAATPSGLTIVEIAGTVAVLDGERWTPLPLDALTSGTGLASLVTVDTVPHGAWVWDVDASGGWLTLADPLASFARVGRLQVGTGAVTLPPGFGLLSARAESNGDRVVVEVGGPGGTCRMAAVYASPFTTAEPIGADWVPASTVEEPDIAWLSSPDGTGWRTAVSDTDTFDVRCPAATDAAALVKAVRFAYHQSRDG